MKHYAIKPWYSGGRKFWLVVSTRWTTRSGLPLAMNVFSSECEARDCAEAWERE